MTSANHPVADLCQERIKRRPVLGGLVNEYERAGRRYRNSAAHSLGWDSRHAQAGDSPFEPAGSASASGPP